MNWHNINIYWCFIYERCSSWHTFNTFMSWMRYFILIFLFIVNVYKKYTLKCNLFPAVNYIKIIQWSKITGNSINYVSMPFNLSVNFICRYWVWYLFIWLIRHCIFVLFFLFTLKLHNTASKADHFIESYLYLRFDLFGSGKWNSKRCSREWFYLICNVNIVTLIHSRINSIEQWAMSNPK